MIREGNDREKSTLCNGEDEMVLWPLILLLYILKGEQYNETVAKSKNREGQNQAKD